MKKIPLTQHRIAIVDDDDFDQINQWKWYLRSTGYAARNSRASEGARQTIYMHREIAMVKTGEEVDHISGDLLDNRRSNLRKCNHAQNHGNQKLPRNNTSGYKGVHSPKVAQHRSKPWVAMIHVNSKTLHLGRFATALEAAVAYDEAAKKHFGEFARPNFPN